MDFIQINLTDRHLVSGVFEVVLEQFEIAFVDFIDQMHRKIVKVVLHGVQSLWSVSFGFVEAWNFVQVHFFWSFDAFKDMLPALIELFGPKDVVVPPAVVDQRGNMPRRSRPVNVGVHRTPPANGVSGKQQEAAEALDLVKGFFTVFASNLDPVFLHQHWYHIAAIAPTVSLNAANFVKKRLQNACVGIADAGKGIGVVAGDGFGDRLAAFFLPLVVQTSFRVVNISVEKHTMIRIVNAVRLFLDFL